MKREEYEALRTEIVTHMQICSQYYLTTITATGAILGITFALKNPSSWLLLAPLVIILPSAFNYASRSESITRIGTYIQVFHEQANGGPGWETRLYRIAPQLGPWGFYAIVNRVLYTGVFAALGLFCVVLFHHYSDVSLLLKLVICIAMVTLLTIAEYRLLSVPSRRQRYLDLWTEVLKEEQERIP